VSGFSGADVEQLRALGSRMKVQSAKLREIANSSTFALMAAQWTGNNIDAVRNNWRRQSLPTITGLADALHEMSVQLEKNAADQERVSGGGSPVDIDRWIGEWRHKIEDFLEGIVGVLPKFFFPAGGDGHGQNQEGVGGPGHEPIQPPIAVPATPQIPRPGDVSGALSDPPPSQEAYDSRAGNMYQGSNGTWYSTPNGQCTSWVQFRRDQLDLAIPHGNGGATAGSLAAHGTSPTLGAVGSWGAGTDSDPGHTFIVEGITPGNPRTITISEMNSNDPNNPNDGFGRVSSATYKEVSEGVWTDQFGHRRNVTFGQ
jgi:surface antigen